MFQPSIASLSSLTLHGVLLATLWIWPPATTGQRFLLKSDAASIAAAPVETIHLEAMPSSPPLEFLDATVEPEPVIVEPVPEQFDLTKSPVTLVTPTKVEWTTPVLSPPATSSASPPPEPPSESVTGSSLELADFSENAPPVYPEEAIRHRQEGIVVLKLQVAEDGRVLSVEIVSSSGFPLLDASAVDAVSKWRGHPARRMGTAVATVEVLPIRFRL